MASDLPVDEDALFAEVQSVFADADADAALAASNDHGRRWEDVCERRGVRVRRRYFGDDGIATLLGVGEIAADEATIKRTIMALDRRGEWDLFWERGGIVDDMEPGVRALVHFTTKSPSFAVWARDFLVLAAERRCAASGALFAFGRSVTPVDGSTTRPPPSSSCVRGVAHYFSFRVRTLSPGRCEVAYLLKVDACGWMPTAVVDMASKYQPLLVVGLRRVITGTTLPAPAPAPSGTTPVTTTTTATTSDDASANADDSTKK